MTARLMAVVCAVAIMGTADPAWAQGWTGAYVGGAVGGAMTMTSVDETVTFDTDLDGGFGDSIRTLAGADAFSPGFCGGLALGPTAAAGCSDDAKNGVTFGGRLGYDRQFGRLVVGALVDVSTADIIDDVTAFSVTPAFYSFSRDVGMVAGLRARAGVVMERVLIYGTGGPAWGRIGQRFTSSNMANAFVTVNQEGETDDDGFAGEMVWGYQAGGGVEVKIASRFTVTGEYIFASFDNAEVSTVRSTQGTAPASNPFILVNPAGSDLKRTDSFTFSTVKVGLSYRF